MAVNKEEMYLDRDALKQTADAYHKSGFNCAQSVICALAPCIDLDEHVAFVLTEAFGASVQPLTKITPSVRRTVRASIGLEVTCAMKKENDTSTYTTFPSGAMHSAPVYIAVLVYHHAFEFAPTSRAFFVEIECGKPDT